MAMLKVSFADGGDVTGIVYGFYWRYGKRIIFPSISSMVIIRTSKGIDFANI